MISININAHDFDMHRAAAAIAVKYSFSIAYWFLQLFQLLSARAIFEEILRADHQDRKIDW